LEWWLLVWYDTTQAFGSTKIQQINAFGPVLIGLLVVMNGVFGVFTVCCSSNKKIDVIYLMGAAVAAAAAAAMVWIYALRVYECRNICLYNQKTQDIHATLLAFSLGCCAMSVFGMIASSLAICRKL